MTYNIGDKSIIFKYISINLKNAYLSTIEVSNEFTLDLAKHIYNYLKFNYPKLELGDNINTEDLAEYFLRGHTTEDFVDENAGAWVYVKPDSYDEDENTSLIIYDTSQETIPESINDINKYNISSWKINDSIIQFLQPGVIIDTYSNMDEIAQAQTLLIPTGYVPSELGNIDLSKDKAFYDTCYLIQKSKQVENNLIVASGYFDIYVESFARGLSEVRK